MLSSSGAKTARQGREKQRYGEGGERLVAGCVVLREVAPSAPPDLDSASPRSVPLSSSPHTTPHWRWATPALPACHAARPRAQAPRRLKSAVGARISLCVPRVACTTITQRVTRRCGQGADGGRECLLISSKDPSLWIFPKGGWETDETLEEAACRETLEVVLLRCPWSWLCNLQCHDPQRVGKLVRILPHLLCA
jgi:hypothetical protein